MPVGGRLRPYVSGVTGVKTALASVGRETPLYLPPRVNRTECHYHDSHLGTYDSPATIADREVGGVFFLNDIPQGSSMLQRTGQRVTLLSLQIRGALYANAGPVEGCTWMIVYDRDAPGTLPTFSNIFNTITPESFQNNNERDRFSILYRSNVSIEGTPAAPTMNSHKLIDMKLDLGSLRTTYSTVGSTGIADVRYGALYFVNCGIGRFVGQGDTNPHFYLNFRLTFSP